MEGWVNVKMEGTTIECTRDRTNVGRITQIYHAVLDALNVDVDLQVGLVHREIAAPNNLQTT